MLRDRISYGLNVVTSLPCGQVPPTFGDESETAPEVEQSNGQLGQRGGGARLVAAAAGIVAGHNRGDPAAAPAAGGAGAERRHRRRRGPRAGRHAQPEVPQQDQQHECWCRTPPR